VPAATVDGQIDSIFSRWTAATPGCAVGAAVDGKPVLSKAYGLADLEHDVRNTPDTIFEAGSVSKQFTAAAVLLLAREGKLALDDPIRRYLRELPDYAANVTIRHMLNHTSGIRDWGSLEGIAGWPRTSRVYTHAHVLEVLSSQRALNFPAGTRWSYSNSGYNLAAMLVARVSGMPFAEFTKKRIFEPLGMTHTSWRDDHTRVVKNRAIAYDDRNGDFHIEMPFENVYGNGGLLTTVGDLLTWNENFSTPRVGDASVVAEQQQAGKFNDGRVHDYALGLMVGSYKGVRQIDHSGSTAGYRAHLARYPDQHVSVAVLCNVSSGAATQYARNVADVYLAGHLKPADLKPSHALTADESAKIAGLYRDVARGTATTIVRDDSGLRVQGGPTIIALSATRFTTAAHQQWQFDGPARVRVTDAFGTVDLLERVEPVTALDQKARAAYPGTYANDEIETVLTVASEGDALVMRRRPDTTITLTPLYADTFRAGEGIGLVIFRRDKSQRVTGLSVVQDRVWDLRFTRQGLKSTN
jgi:CubicO group peptidase (beta-lactamase class C family)